VDTVRQRIRDQAILELNTDQPTGLPVVTKRRWHPGEDDGPLSIAVVFLEEPTRQIGGRGGSLQDRDLHIGVQCVVGVTHRDEADDALEPALAWATSVISSSNLDGYATETTEVSTVWEQAKMDKFYLAATLVFRIRYQTVRDDLTSIQ
jgi:hypothetical protein